LIVVFTCYLTAQRFKEGEPVQNDAAVYNWTVTTSGQHVDVNRTFNATYAFYQNVTVTPYISWAQKDIDMNLGPPVQIRYDVKQLKYS